MGNTSTNFKNKWTDGVIWDISSLTCIKHAKLLMKKMPDNQCPKEFESSQRPSHSEEEEETVGELAWRELMQSSRRGTRYDQLLWILMMFCIFYGLFVIFIYPSHPSESKSKSRWQKLHCMRWVVALRRNSAPLERQPNTYMKPESILSSITCEAISAIHICQLTTQMRTVWGWHYRTIACTLKRMIKLQLRCLSNPHPPPDTPNPPHNKSQGLEPSMPF